jgi:hypothetical protein
MIDFVAKWLTTLALILVGRDLVHARQATWLVVALPGEAFEKRSRRLETSRVPGSNMSVVHLTPRGGLCAPALPVTPRPVERGGAFMRNSRVIALHKADRVALGSGPLYRAHPAARSLV